MWQLRRLSEAGAERVRFEERLAEPPFDGASPPPDPDLRRVRITGVPDWDHYVLLAGKYMWGEVGYQLLVPVRAVDGSVLVNTGWVPADEVAPVLARERGVTGARTYDGLARVFAEDPSAAGTFPLEDGYQRHWRSISPKAMASSADVPGFVLYEGEGISADAPIPDRDPPIGGWRTEAPERPHGQYAFTWISLMFTLILVWLSASTQRVEAPGPPSA